MAHTIMTISLGSHVTDRAVGLVPAVVTYPGRQHWAGLVCSLLYADPYCAGDCHRAKGEEGEAGGSGSEGQRNVITTLSSFLGSRPPAAAQLPPSQGEPPPEATLPPPAEAQAVAAVLRLLERHRESGSIPELVAAAIVALTDAPPERRLPAGALEALLQLDLLVGGELSYIVLKLLATGEVLLRMAVSNVVVFVCWCKQLQGTLGKQRNLQAYRLPLAWHAVALKLTYFER